MIPSSGTELIFKKCAQSNLFPFDKFINSKWGKFVEFAIDFPPDISVAFRKLQAHYKFNATAMQYDIQSDNSDQGQSTPAYTQCIDSEPIENEIIGSQLKRTNWHLMQFSMWCIELTLLNRAGDAIDTMAVWISNELMKSWREMPSNKVEMSMSDAIPFSARISHHIRVIFSSLFTAERNCGVSIFIA